MSEVGAASLAGRTRRLRLWTGAVLFAYVTTHLANHTLGLISLPAMEAGRWWFLALWRNPLGTVALYGALATHLVLGLFALYQRRHLRIPPAEALQLLFGLSIPPLLVSHVIGTRIAHAWLGTTDNYVRVVLVLWELRPEAGTRQAAVLVIAWVHGCIGVYYWARLRRWYPRLRPVLYAVSLLLPVLALLGFAHAGRAAAAMMAGEPGFVERLARETNAPDATERAMLDWLHASVLWSYGAAVGFVLAARGVRTLCARRQRQIRITYPGEREVAIVPGLTVLEASRLAGIPHASVCGGRGRCSTCRVRVSEPAASLPPASVEEQRVLTRVGAPPNVRLACQLRPTRDIAVTPLVPPSLPAGASVTAPPTQGGREREVAILFADLRGFTRIAEHRLPYDVVFLLNRYFEVVGDAVRGAGGVVNQFTGDGAMALFGLEVSAADACRHALHAARRMASGVAGLSRELADELRTPLRIGMGIHVGPAVVGRMGFAEAAYLTAVGDTVHVASRLQDLTKEYDCELIVSEQVVQRTGLETATLARHEVTVRNRREPLAVYVVKDVLALAHGVS